MLLIDKKHLLAISEFTATKDNRFYLLGVGITVKDNVCRLTASNGHYLATYTFDCAHDDISVTIPPEIIKTACKLDKGPAIALIDNKLGALDFKPLSDYPNCEQVWPKEIANEWTSIDPALYAPIIKAAKILGYDTRGIKTGYFEKGYIWELNGIRGIIMALLAEKLTEIPKF